MRYQKDQLIHGFRVQRAEESQDPKGNIFQMEHERTGARLFFLDNGAENMVFSISFRTLPQDSTGVFHILEHSLLCGSEKYPMKEPFVELLKSSMNTFLNAMTFPDMTMFPVASRNPRDLMNLTGVYLDAVFAPASMKDRKRFCQEGWHIDRDEEGNPEYRGVVYNEMKGAMSETDALIEHELVSMLFPDTYNGYNSGGDPEQITDLTYEEYKRQYERCYHPGNAWIYLDGAVPMEEMLPLLDETFSSYNKRTNHPEFSYQQPKGSERTIYYELAPEEEPENRGYLTIARITDTWRDRAENMARCIVADVLTGSNEAPLKRAALERNLAKDLNLSLDDTGLQSWVAIHAEHVTDGKENEILALLEETGRQISQTGLDRDAVEASLNRTVFNLREEEEPQGIGRCIRSMGTWLYGGDPTEALESAKLIRTLKTWLDDGTFNRLAEDMLLNRKNAAVLHTVPSATLGEERREREARKLRQALENMSEEERSETERLREEIENWQLTPDREEDLATLPLLRREDADVAPEWTETETMRINGVPVMIHRIPCNGVVHLRAYFLLTDLSLEELTKISLFVGMLGRLPTRKYSALRLQQEIRRVTGNLGFSVVSWSKAGDDNHCTPCLTAYVSALEEYAGEAQELLAEILCNTVIDGQEDKIIEIMMQNEISTRERIVSAGHLLAVRKILSRFSSESAVKNAIDGDRMCRYIHSFAADPAGHMSAFLESANNLLLRTICRDRLTLSVTSGNDLQPEILAHSFPMGSSVPESASWQEEDDGINGFRIPAQIGFAGRGYRLSRCGLAFTGTMWLACGILSLGHYWNKVRVQGGAYGAGIQIDRMGNLYSYSFRDPTPAKTLQADSGATAFLQEFAKTEKNPDRYIISALNELNPLLSARDKGLLADTRMFTGYTRELNERIRLEVLNTTPEQLADCGEWLNTFARDGRTCIVAHDEVLRQCGCEKIGEL